MWPEICTDLRVLNCNNMSLWVTVRKAPTTMITFSVINEEKLSGSQCCNLSEICCIKCKIVFFRELWEILQRGEQLERRGSLYVHENITMTSNYMCLFDSVWYTNITKVSYFYSQYSILNFLAWKLGDPRCCGQSWHRRAKGNSLLAHAQRLTPQCSLALPSLFVSVVMMWPLPRVLLEIQAYLAEMAIQE